MKKRGWEMGYIFPAEWEERTLVASTLVDSDWDIVEFGAGNAHLKNIIGKSQRYLATDIVIRDSSFRLVNLDNQLILPSKFDAGIALGVLEYLNDIQYSLNQISANLPNFITTYCVVKSKFIRFKTLRKYIGWKNHLSKEEFEEIISKSGFNIQAEIEIENNLFYIQYLYKLQKTDV